MLAMNLLTMPLLTIRFGLTGAAFALVITEMFGTGLGWFLTRRAFPLPFNGWHVSRIGLATVLMGFVLAGLKLWLPAGIISFGLIVASGSATYVAAALALDIAGSRKSLTALLRSGRFALSKQVI